MLIHIIESIKLSRDEDHVMSSFRTFIENANHVSSSDRSTFDTSLSIFIHWCENDEIVSDIFNQLKSDNSIFDDWWSENYTGDIIPQVGCKKLNLPPDPKKRDALLYQICLKIHKEEIDLFPFCQDYKNCSPDEAIVYFSKVFFKPLVESIKNDLYDMEDTTEQGNNRHIHTQLLYQDFSTTVNGNVNTKGDAAIGGDANIEKKKLF